jgi:hypothetical protein
MLLHELNLFQFDNVTFGLHGNTLALAGVFAGLAQVLGH